MKAYAVRHEEDNGDYVKTRIYGIFESQEKAKEGLWQLLNLFGCPEEFIEEAVKNGGGTRYDETFSIQEYELNKLCI